MDLQRTADRCVLDALATNVRRHAWKGHLENMLRSNATLATYQHPDWEDEPEPSSYIHALVTSVAPGSTQIRFGRYIASLAQSDVAWTGRKIAAILKPGDIVYVKIVWLGAHGKSRVP